MLTCVHRVIGIGKMNRRSPLQGFAHTAVNKNPRLLHKPKSAHCTINLKATTIENKSGDVGFRDFDAGPACQHVFNHGQHLFHHGHPSPR